MLQLLITSLLVMSRVARAMDIWVAVGSDDMMFHPANISANVGDVVHFDFTVNTLGTMGNQTVTQVSYEHPCTALAGGFSSPLIYVDFQIFSVEITDEAPIWFASASTLNDPQQDSCQLGMVGAINAPDLGAQTYGAFASAARDTQPGGFASIPVNGSGNGSGIGATVIGSIVGLPISTPPEAPSPPASPGSSGLSAGAIAGICIACIVVLIGKLLLIRRVIIVRRQRSSARGEWMRRLEMSLRKGKELDDAAKAKELEAGANAKPELGV